MLKTRCEKMSLIGQAVLEYALVLAIVSAALTAMGLYMRRAVQGGLYKIEERVAAKQNTSYDATGAGCGGPGQLACP